MNFEIIYPEICCLFGDKANGEYLKRCLPEWNFYATGVNETPRFLSGDMDLVYICSMSEKSQQLAIEKLSSFSGVLREAFKNKKTFFLLTGNAFEIFGEGITDEKGEKLPALGLLGCHSKRFAPKRHNSLLLGNFEDIEVLGYTSRFSHSYAEGEQSLFEITKGSGMNENVKYEGIKRENLWATYMLGPLLIANPLLTEKLLAKLGREKAELPFRQALMQAYEAKLEEYKKPSLSLD
ncbi:MAG: hypothetical protein GX061_04445 [Eubacteriaceae bacterium]|nr:hypothetical protein [Eubacteriaceae bacterium]